MTGPHTRLAAAGALALALVAAAALVLIARGWSGGEGGTYAPTEPTVATRLEPPSALFGDAVTATAYVLVDTDEVDPRSVSLAATFKPFQAFESGRTVTDGIGGSALVTFTHRLQCVTGACLRAMETEERGGRLRTVPISFPRATVTARSRDGEPVAVTAPWPELVVHSRLTADDISAGVPEAEPFTAPPVSFSTSPDLLAWLLVAGAAVLVVAAGVLVAGVVSRARREKQLQLPEHLTPTERALALARHALDAGDVAGGRKALERLAAELDRGGRNDLALAADRLAWSSRGPSTEALDELALSVRSSANGR